MQTMAIDLSDKDIAGVSANKESVEKKEVKPQISAEPSKNINKLFGK
jgi:hypothetical protein